MIFITLGTQDKPFNRLLEAVQREIDKGNIKDKVVVQAGYTKFKSKDMEVFDLIPMDEFDKLMNKCDLLITHGGVGSIVGGLNKDKVVIAAARLEKYGEHLNDHQLQIIDNFSKAGYILGLDNFDDLGDLLEQAKSFKPKKYKSNKEKFIKLIENEIEKLTK
jgi:UDP-N-acetylglucosamine transferase subunit ALG13